MKTLHWGWRIGILYGVFALATISWVGYAMTKEVDLVRTDYYQYSLQQDQTTQALSNAKALGTSAMISLNRESHSILVRIPSGQASNVRGTVILTRPNSIKSDQSYPLVPTTDGTMSIPTAALSRGIWNVTVRWSAPTGIAYEMHSRDSL